MSTIDPTRPAPPRRFLCLVSVNVTRLCRRGACYAAACVCRAINNVTLAIAVTVAQRNPMRAFAAHAPNFAPRHGHAEQCREFFGAEQRVVVFGDTFERRRYLFGWRRVPLTGPCD